MNSETLEAWLQVAASYCPTTSLMALLGELGDAPGIVKARNSELAASGLNSEAITRLRKPASGVEKLHQWLEGENTHFVPFNDERYPDLLREIRDAPPLLYVRGNVDALKFPLLAIVGTRKPTAGGKDTARQFAAELAKNGLGIISGMALGIDTEAHLGALDAGGLTLAVLGTGIDRVYPAANRDLAHRLANEGTLISEFPLGSEPQKFNFPRRNRIISALSLGTLVVEAAQRSGSLISARLAAEQGRDVFAIPGSIHNPMARGTHQLIREGARLVESTADIFTELAPLTQLLRQNQLQDKADKRSQATGSETDGPEYQALLEKMGFDAISISDLSERCGLTAAELSSMLLILELEGVVDALPGGRYARLK
ncbi:MAG: DNA-processing protein DprA [Pseudomonadota bacterium]